MLSICLFSLCEPFCCFFSPYLAPPKCQEQKEEKERNYRADYSWGLADKMLMPKLRPNTWRLFFVRVYLNVICMLLLF